MLWMRDSPELHNGCGCAFCAARMAEVVSRKYKILHGLAVYDRALQAEACENDFLHTPSCFPKETLAQLQQFGQETFEKERAGSTAAKRMWSPIMNKGDERIDRKECEEGRER